MSVVFDAFPATSFERTGQSYNALLLHLNELANHVLPGIVFPSDDGGSLQVQQTRRMPRVLATAGVCRRYRRRQDQPRDLPLCHQIGYRDVQMG